MNRRIFVPVLVAVTALGAAADAMAQEMDLVSVELGARFFLGEANGRLRKGPATSHVDIDEDLDGAGDATGAGLALTGKLQGGHTFSFQGWQFNSEGSATQGETQGFGSLTLAQGTEVDSDTEIRFVAAKVVFGLTPEREPYRVGLGLGGRVFHWNTEVTLSTGETESLNLRMLYPVAELEASYSIGEAVEIKAEAGAGMPSYSKKGIEIENPIEVRAGVRISLGGLTIEGGYQVIDVLLKDDENTVDERSANVNLAGVYFEIAARF